MWPTEWWDINKLKEMKISIVPAGDYHSNYGGGQVYVRRLVAELERQGHEVVIGFDPTAEVVHAHGDKAATVLKAKSAGLPCVVTAHHGGILCPAGTLLNHRDEICHQPACHERCLPCYLKTILSGRWWYPLMRHLKPASYRTLGMRLKHLPFLPFITPIGQAALAIEGRLNDWQTIRENASLLIAPSQAIADSMALNGAERQKIRVVPHGIPPYGEQTAAQPRNLAKTMFYYVGRIARIKGLHILLQAFEGIEEAELHIIGGASSKEEKRYERELKRRYAGNRRIVWEGKVDDPKELAALTQRMSCLVHPTLCMEIFGLNIGEALMQGHWVIATRCGGAEMQLREGENGNLVATNDVSALRAAMLAYLAHPTTPSGPQPVTLEQHTNQLVEIYQSLS